MCSHKFWTFHSEGGTKRSQGHGCPCVERPAGREDTRGCTSLWPSVPVSLPLIQSNAGDESAEKTRSMQKLEVGRRLGGRRRQRETEQMSGWRWLLMNTERFRCGLSVCGIQCLSTDLKANCFSGNRMELDTCSRSLSIHRLSRGQGSVIRASVGRDTAIRRLSLQHQF